MKPTSLMYLHKISHLVQKFRRSSKGTTLNYLLDYIENCHIWDILSCIALLVKNLYKFDYI